jgi:hypothetical protein
MEVVRRRSHLDWLRFGVDIFDRDFYLARKKPFGTYAHLEVFQIQLPVLIQSAREQAWGQRPRPAALEA